MKNIFQRIMDSLGGFTTRHERFIFTTLARILAAGCLLIALYFAWRLSMQLKM